MRNFIAIFLLLLYLMLSFSVCGRQPENESTQDIVVFQPSPSQSGVDDFLNHTETGDTGYETDTCHNITPSGDFRNIRIPDFQVRSFLRQFSII